MKDIYLNKNIIGSDETGVGDYLTPLVGAAVFVPKENVQKLINLGVTDSKKLTDKKILELAEEIAPYIKQSIRAMSQAQYNFLTSNKNYNAHELKLLLHLKAINAIEARVEDVDLVIMDQFADLSNLNKYHAKLSRDEDVKMPKAKLITVTGGELEHVAVAAASIVARAHFVKLMQEQNKKWDMSFPLGTNGIVENTARDFVAKHGRKALYEVAKLSFKTTEKI